MNPFHLCCFKGQMCESVLCLVFADEEEMDIILLSSGCNSFYSLVFFSIVYFRFSSLSHFSFESSPFSFSWDKKRKSYSDCLYVFSLLLLHSSHVEILRETSERSTVKRVGIMWKGEERKRKKVVDTKQEKKIGWWQCLMCLYPFGFKGQKRRRQQDEKARKRVRENGDVCRWWKAISLKMSHHHQSVNAGQSKC